MKIRLARFNIYLLLVVLVLCPSCQTTEQRKKSKEASTLRLFLEAHRQAGSTGGVPVYRQSPVLMNVEREPFLSEEEVDTCSVVDLPGGFAIRVQFSGHGALVLEEVTVSNKGKHIIIQSDFGETRWLAAPVINRRISNGDLQFTPDATRDEAERIVRGLNNFVAKLKSKSGGF